MTNNKKHIKIIDVEALDEIDDNDGGPIDTVDIFDSVEEGDYQDVEHGKRHRIEDVENPLSNESLEVLRDNIFDSEPDKGEEE